MPLAFHQKHLPGPCARLSWCVLALTPAAVQPGESKGRRQLDVSSLLSPSFLK